MTHNHSLQRTEGLLSTYRHHRHCQFRLFEDLIVLRILRESGKLREPGSHSTRLRVSGGKEISGGLVRLPSIGRKVIPTPVKVDTFPTRHRPFRTGSTKVEVPNPRIVENLAPGINSGARCVQDRKR